MSDEVDECPTWDDINKRSSDIYKLMHDPISDDDTYNKYMTGTYGVDVIAKFVSRIESVNHGKLAYSFIDIGGLNLYKRINEVGLNIGEFKDLMIRAQLSDNMFIREHIARTMFDVFHTKSGVMVRVEKSMYAFLSTIAEQLAIKKGSMLAVAYFLGFKELSERDSLYVDLIGKDKDVRNDLYDASKISDLLVDFVDVLVLLDKGGIL